VNNNNNNSEENYAIFQNPNHGELPDYATVLKKQANNKIKYQQQEEESIFNLGKPLPKSNPIMMENNDNNYEDNLNSSMKNECNGK